MITTQHLVHIQYQNEWKWAKAVEVSAEGKLVTMRSEGGDTFMMKTECQDTTTGYRPSERPSNEPSPPLSDYRK